MWEALLCVSKGDGQLIEDLLADTDRLLRRPSVFHGCPWTVHFHSVVAAVEATS